jgi:hypothetical protein
MKIIGIKNLRFVCILSALALCGCAQQYVIKLNNGVQLTTASKPKLKGTNYHFKDARGQDNVVPQGRVVEIEPASMAREEKKFTPQQPQKKHWWQFWR